MSEISFSYIFGCSMNHNIISLCLNSDNICTGSATGEIAIWKKNKGWEVGVICSLPEDTPCICLCIVPPAIEIQRFLGAQSLIISLHANNKIRAWDINDGKCLAYSGELFLEENNLQHIVSSSNGNAIVAGENDIFVVDVYHMTRISYFNTETKVLDLICYKDEIIAADCKKLYIFNMNSEYMAEGTVKVFEKLVNKPKLACKDNMLFISRHNELFVLNKLKLSENNVYSITFGSNISYLDISSNNIVVMVNHYIYCYLMAELINYDPKVNKNPRPRQYILSFSSKIHKVFGDLVYMTDENSIYSYDMTTSKTENYKFFLPDNDFSILNPEEKITSRNILITTELLYAIGTNAGKTIVFTINSQSKLIYFYSKTEVTTIHLHKNSLIIGYRNETISFWNFQIQQGTVSNLFPEKTIEVWASHVKVIIKIDFSKRNIDFFNEMSWKSSKISWADIGIGQCESGSILLISFETKEILCYFQALMSMIVKAHMYLNLEYLAVNCANGNIYIFNMTLQAIEREITGDSVLNFDNIGIINGDLLKNMNKSDTYLPCIQFYFAESSKKAVEVKFLTIGKTYFPSLNINLAKFIKASHQYTQDYIDSITAVISKDLFKQGIFGINKALSFKCDWVSSIHANSLRVASLLSLGLQTPQLKTDTMSLIIYSLNPVFHLRTKLLDYIEFEPEIIQIASKLLFSQKKKSLRSSKRAMSNAVGTNFSNEKYHCQRIFISLFEAISITILTCESIYAKSLQNPIIIDLLIKMLKSGESGYILLACEMMKKAQYLLADQLKDSQLEDIMKELLLYSCKDFKHVNKSFFYKVITSLAMKNLTKFCKTLGSEIKNNDLDSNYQHNVLFIIEFFIIHHYLESTSVLDDLGDFLLIAHNLKAFTDDKNYSSDFTSVLQTFVSLLPMTKQSQEGRFLIIGLPTGWLTIYDLKSDKKWKSFHVFETTISALDTRNSYIACYSSQENLVKILKIDQGLFGGMIGHGDIKMIERIPLNEIEPLAGSYQDMLKIMKIRWIGYRNLSVIRENRQEYIISASKI